jgi:hypothetical protein
MKTIYVLLAALLAGSTMQAQYKKASFLNKSGRTYDLGFTGRFLSGGGGAVPGFYFSYGRDKGKRVFHWFDLELLAPTKFHYTTADLANPGTSASVSGTTTIGLAYRYNLACYLTDIENTETKFKPFVTAGINLLLKGRNAKTLDILPYNVSYDNFNCGANAGIGGIYVLSEKIGIKGVIGYNLQTQIAPLKIESGGYSVYNPFSSHPYIGVGVRFAMSGDDD